MQKKFGVMVGAALIGVFGVQVLEAQTFTPTFMAPYASSDVGVYLSDGPGDFAIEGIWRGNYGGQDLGLRGGVADTDDLSILVGAEIRHPVALAAPLAIAVTGSAQGVFGDAEGVGFLVGLTGGYRFGDPSLSFTPYLHPRIGLVKELGGGDFDLELLADFGLDVRLSPQLDLRFGVNIDSQRGAADWGVGFAWR